MQPKLYLKTKIHCYPTRTGKIHKITELNYYQKHEKTGELFPVDFIQFIAGLKKNQQFSIKILTDPYFNPQELFDC